MIPEKMRQVLQYEGVVAIATQGPEGPHLVNTWNSYLEITPDEHLLIPVGFMHKTEQNISKNNRVLIMLGARQVEGFNGPGTGFLIRGTAAFITAGPHFTAFKAKFPWARAVLEVTPESVQQTL